jgi:DNA-directed RNA polymerase subunit RPC12/RpoP
MTEHTPTLNHLRAEYLDLCTKRFGYSTQYAEEWDRALAAHDAEVVAEFESDPAKDERLVRYMAMVTPLGYQSALTVVQEMTKLLATEEIARASIVAEEPEARAWEPADGDKRCQECGRENPVWWADNGDWNVIMPDDGVLCPTCYHRAWLEARPGMPVEQETP